MAPKIKLISIERPCENPSCGRSFASKTNPDGTPAKGYPARFCSRACARAVGNREIVQDRKVSTTGGYGSHADLREAWDTSAASMCPCGGRIPYELRHQRKYCSPECRKEYGNSGRIADPTKRVTFACERCGTEVTRYKGYGSGALRFCSNECSARSNTQRRVCVDDVVLDSGWEALVWGLCALRKVPIERFDRRGCVEVGDGWYGPDFVMAGYYVEVKGLEDDDDRERYAAWRAAGNPLVVVDRERLEALVAGDMVALVDSWAC